MAHTDQTGCSDEFDSSFGSTSDQIVMDVPFATITTSPQPLTSRAGQPVLRGKDLSLLLKSGDKYQTPQESLYFREKMTCKKMTPRKDRKM